MSPSGPSTLSPPPLLPFPPPLLPFLSPGPKPHPLHLLRLRLLPMVSLTTTTSSPAALPAASTTAPASSVSPAANKRPHLAGDDAPWHAAGTGSTGISLVPRIHHARMVRLAQDDSSVYALAVIKVEIQVWKIYCINRPIPTLPINLASAARSEAEFEKAGEKLVCVGQDTRLNYRAIDLRTPVNQAIF